MTLTLEIPETVETALEAKAARLGVPVERYASDVLARDVQDEAPTNFLELLSAGRARIAAGKSRPITPDDISAAIADARP